MVSLFAKTPALIPPANPPIANIPCAKPYSLFPSLAPRSKTSVMIYGMPTRIMDDKNKLIPHIIRSTFPIVGFSFRIKWILLEKSSSTIFHI